VILQLSKDTNENDWVSLHILHSPRGKDLEIVSPYDKHALVPSFKNKAENFVRVVVIQRGDLAVLQNGTVLRAFAEQINKKNGSKSPDKQAPNDSPMPFDQTSAKANLEAVAKQHGLQPEEVDKAIRAWGAKTTDPYDAGLAALYERNYAKATVDLQTSLKQAEEKLAWDQKAVADRAFFLGLSLYIQGRYKESVVAYQKALQIRPNDSSLLNGVGGSLLAAGDYSTAEEMFQRAVNIDERAVPRNDLQLASSYDGLGRVFRFRGKLAGAEYNFRQALRINERILGFNHPEVAANLSNLAEVFLASDQPEKAKPLLDEALAIDKAALGLDSIEEAIDLQDLGTVAIEMGDSEVAVDLLYESLRIKELRLGKDHPVVAATQSNLGVALNEQGKYAEAEPLLRSSLATKEKTVSPKSPSIAITLVALAKSLMGTGKYDEAEQLLKRARSLDEKAFGPGNPEVATDIRELAQLHMLKKDYTEAEKLFQQALAIDAKTSEPEHPKFAMAKDLDGLAWALHLSGNNADAEKKWKEALAIAERLFGPDGVQTKQIEKHLEDLHQLSSQQAPPTTKK